MRKPYDVWDVLVKGLVDLLEKVSTLLQLPATNLPRLQQEARVQIRAKIIEKFRTVWDMASKIESEAQKVGQMIHDLIDDINDYAIQYKEIGQ